MTPSTVAATVLLLPAQIALVTARRAIKTVAPQGGQHTSRRNAWEAMSSDLRLSRARQDADAEMRRLIAAPRQEADPLSARLIR